MIKSFKTGFKIGFLHGIMCSILLILLNLLYTKKILTLLAITVYLGLGFGIGFGVLAVFIGIFWRLLFGKSEIKKKVSPALFLGAAGVLAYAAGQYWLDLAEFRFSILPVSIKLMNWFAWTLAVSSLIALVGFLIQWKTKEEAEPLLVRHSRRLIFRVLPIVLLIITMISVDSNKSMTVTETPKKAEPKKHVEVSQEVSVVPVKATVVKKNVKPKVETVSISSAKQNPIIFIGWDGADWAVAQPLMDQGKLPNLKKLVERGVSGNIKTFRPTLSPAIWTSIATGKKPIKTGILHFLRIGGSTFFDESLGAVPMNRVMTGTEYFFLTPMNMTLRMAEYGFWTLLANDRTNRETKAVWNIAGDEGKKVAVVNMMVTSPVEKINGWMVSDYLQQRMKGSPDVTSPPTLYGEIRPMEITENDVTALQLGRLFPKPELAKELSEVNRPPNAIYYNVLQQAYAEDQSTSKYGEYLFKTYHPELTIVYFHGPDTICHFFWKFYKPNDFWGVKEKDKELFGEMINRYYEMTDELLKPYVDQLDNGATIVLCSDHGFESMSPLVEKLKGVNHSLISGDHRHMPPGIVVMAGPQIQSHVKLPKLLNVLDITPTLLWFLNVPIGEDMDGEIALEAVTKEYAVSHPPQFITSYESSDGKNIATEGSQMTEQYRERLKGLGYIQ